jgi:hypothetical protein
MKNKKGQESHDHLIKIIIGIVLFIILLYAIRYLIKFITGGAS